MIASKTVRDKSSGPNNIVSVVPIIECPLENERLSADPWCTDSDWQLLSLAPVISVMVLSALAGLNERSKETST